MLLVVHELSFIWAMYAAHFHFAADMFNCHFGSLSSSHSVSEINNQQKAVNINKIQKKKKKKNLKCMNEIFEMNLKNRFEKLEEGMVQCIPTNICIVTSDNVAWQRNI